VEAARKFSHAPNRQIHLVDVRDANLDHHAVAQNTIHRKLWHNHQRRRSTLDLKVWVGASASNVGGTRRKCQ
jgi:hypothetical protein